MSEIQRYDFSSDGHYPSNSGGWVDADEAEAKIKQLEQELAVANKCINSLRLSLGETRLRNGDHEANLIELNALLEQSKKDQARYQYVRNMPPEDFSAIKGDCAAFDKAIDAAIKESSK